MSFRRQMLLIRVWQVLATVALVVVAVLLGRLHWLGWAVLLVWPELLVVVPLAVGVVQLRSVRSGPPSLAPVPADAIDPATRVQAEAALIEHIVADPRFQLVGWLRVTEHPATQDMLVACDGKAVVIAHVAQDGRVISVGCYANIGEHEIGSRLMASSTYLWLPGTSDEYLLIDRPAAELLQLHRARTAGVALAPITDPLAHLVDAYPAEYAREFAASGRYLDADGMARRSWRGAVRIMWKNHPRSRRRLIQAANDRSHAVMRAAGLRAPEPGRPMPDPAAELQVRRLGLQ